MILPPLWVMSAALSGVVCFGAGYQLRDYQADSKELKETKVAEAKTEKQLLHVGESAEVIEKFKEVERIKYVYIEKKVAQVAQTPFYSASAPACLDDAGLRILAETRRQGAPAPSQSEGPVPEIGTP